MQENIEQHQEQSENFPDLTISATPVEELKADQAETVISEDELAGWSKVQLADKLAEYLAGNELPVVMPVAALIRKRLEELQKEEYDRKLAVFMQDGSLAEDFDPKPDPLDEKIEQTWKNLNEKRILQRKQREKSAQENLSVKKIIIEELKELLKGNEKISASYNKFQALQSKWRTTGNVPLADHQTLKENYYFLTGKFYDMVKINNELNALDKKKNTEYKTLLCEKAEQLIEEPSLKKAVDRTRQLQEEWSEIRSTSRELKDELWLRFKAAGDKVFERQKEHLLQLKQQQQSNLEAKTALCQQIELLGQTELTSHKACRDASEKAEAIWEAWQKIGFVPKSDNGSCWKRFKKARQHFYHVVDSFYTKQRGEFAINLEKKIELCVKAEALQESTDWKTATEILKKLQAEWKIVPQVAAKDSDKVWARFRKACNHFFDRKANKDVEKENALKANIQARESFIEKVNSFQPSTEIQQSLDELKKFQDEWNQAGEVPLKEKDRLDNTFGQALETLLGRVKTTAQVDDKLFHRLKYQQMLKSPQGQALIEKERSVIQDQVKKLQAEVNQLENNLSFFGNSKKPNPLLSEYQEKAEKIRLEIKELTERSKLIPVVHSDITTQEQPAQGFSKKGRR